MDRWSCRPGAARWCRATGWRRRSWCDGTSFPSTGIRTWRGNGEKVAPWLFVDEGNPWRTSRPASCVFQDDAKAAPRTRPITWRAVGWGELWDQVEVAVQRAQLDFVIRPFGERGIWVGLPSFHARDPNILAKLKVAIAAAPSWR